MHIDTYRYWDSEHITLCLCMAAYEQRLLFKRKPKHGRWTEDPNLFWKFNFWARSTRLDLVFQFWRMFQDKHHASQDLSRFWSPPILVWCRFAGETTFSHCSYGQIIVRRLHWQKALVGQPIWRMCNLEVLQWSAFDKPISIQSLFPVLPMNHRMSTNSWW